MLTLGTAPTPRTAVPANSPATSRPVLCISPHPDDETLAMGSVIADLAAKGRQVHVLALTRGEASRVRGELNGDTVSPWWGVRHDPSVEGYTPMNPVSFGAARIGEQRAAVGLLGVPAGRIHEAHLPNGGVTVPGAKAAINRLATTLGPVVDVWITSWLVDNHPEHLAAGQAVRQLAAEQPARFPAPHYTILSAYWTDPRLAKVHREWLVPSAGAAARVRNAARAYGGWQPQAGCYGIGWQSVPDLFDRLGRDQRVLVHKD